MAILSHSVESATKYSLNLPTLPFNRPINLVQRLSHFLSAMFIFGREVSATETDNKIRSRQQRKFKRIGISCQLLMIKCCLFRRRVEWNKVDSFLNVDNENKTQEFIKFLLSLRYVSLESSSWREYNVHEVKRQNTLLHPTLWIIFIRRWLCAMNANLKFREITVSIWRHKAANVEWMCKQKTKCCHLQSEFSRKKKNLWMFSHRNQFSMGFSFSITNLLCISIKKS